MKLLKIMICLIIMVALFLSVSAISASALSWDGTSAGGGGSGVAATQPGYAIRTTGDNCIGYRFSVVDKNGNTKNGAVRDVFRNTTYGNYEINNAHKFNTKYNKKQLINNQNNGYSTGATTANCLWESGMGFTTALPVPDGMGTWQNIAANLNRVLDWLGIGSISNLVNGDKVLVEPIYDVKLQNVYHALTVTEIAIYGKWLLGVNWGYGVSATNNSGTWSFIVNYTNRYYPNSLYTPDGQGLWFGAWTVTINIDFYNIINGGWGVGIAYVETKPDFSPTLSVNICEAWKGSKSDRSFYYGNSNGGAFGNFSYANGYPVLGDSVWFAVNFPAESQAVRVRQSVKHGGNWITRDVDLNSTDTDSMWFDVIFTGNEGGGSQPTNNVESGRVLYWITSKQDWIDANGNILKYGAEKSFYIPIKPKINRYQITMFDITGNQAAKANANSTNQVGAVYVGQKVYPKYTYTSDNTWTSYNYLRGAIYQWTNGAWNTIYTNNGGTDLYIDNQALDNTSAYERYSDIGAYTVPDNTANTNGSNRVPFKLWTHWVSDWPNTTETTWIDIPIVKADAELLDIKLIDENGYYTSTPYAGQKVTPQYVYKNNTSCQIFVEGYNDDKTRISGTFAILPNGQIYVNGKQITVSSSTTLSVWGGVYLDGAGFGNTAWESDGWNNAWVKIFTVKSPLTLQFVTPNASYRSGTDVITSYKVINPSGISYNPTSNILVRLTAKKGTTNITTLLKAVVIPSYDENMVYFKWTVPSNMNLTPATLTADIFQNGISVYTRTDQNPTLTANISVPADTKFEKSTPNDFTEENPPVNNSVTNAIWNEWVYENNAFVKKNYGLSLNTGSLSIVPDPNSPSRKYENGVWEMRSGYGFTADWTVSINALTGKTMPLNTAYTNAQTASIYLPEFMYSSTLSKYRSLSLNGINNFQFPSNSNATNNAKLHFTPLWFPNGNYIAQGLVNDLWTPAGMLYGYLNSNAIIILGSAYDDWRIGK